MKPLFQRKNRRNAPATVAFTKAVNGDGKTQLAVYAQCHYAGTVHGPTWSHTSAAVRRCLAELTKICGCGRSYHKLRYVEGQRLMADKR